MKKLTWVSLVFVFMIGLAWVSSSNGGEKPAPPAQLEPVKLPPPQMTGGRPLMEVLKDRKTSRDFKPDKLPLQVLSNLLWAADGVNRPASAMRTAPSAMNWQEIDVYVVMAEGAYLYDAKANVLQPVLAKDVRGDTGRIIQPFVKEAPLNLVYVADFSRVSVMGKVFVSEEEKLMYSSAGAGFIGQNVYLFCASEGLSTVIRGLVDKDALAKDLNLKKTQKIILAQTIGYPKAEK
ncbi:MAG: SagB/ThcOx family dehydrogenase [bacterium]|nr:SagB/ThcOx family dehydrogenase [bacterium]